MIDKHGALEPEEAGGNMIWLEAPDSRLIGKRFKLELQGPSPDGWQDTDPVWIGFYPEAGDPRNDEFDSGEGL